MPVNQQKLDELLGRALVDIGATFNAPLVLIGERLGLYKALASSGPLTSEELARRTETTERYVREWLSSQTSGGYITYHPESGKYSLTEEQAFALAQEDSPAYLPGAFQVALAAIKIQPKIAEAFRTGQGIGWHEHDPELFTGTERFFRPGYAAHLTSSWIPSLQGVEEKLRRGANAADIGCGHGASTILMAEAYPNSRFFGFDYHQPSIDTARKRAKEAGVEERVEFHLARANDFPAKNYDFIAFFDCLHDMGDPKSALAHVRETINPDGTAMIVEPFANDRLEDNVNPVGRLYYSASSLICTPVSRSQEVGLALGAQAGEKRIRDLTKSAGFSSFRRATQTPFNLIFEVKP